MEPKQKKKNKGCELNLPQDKKQYSCAVSLNNVNDHSQERIPTDVQPQTTLINN